MNKILISLIFYFSYFVAYSQGYETENLKYIEYNGPIKVGVKLEPPFTMKSEDGEYHGLCFDLMDRYQENTDFEFEIIEFETFESLCQATESGEVQMSIGPISMTSERARIMDFGSPWMVAGIGIAIDPEFHSVWVDIMKGLFSPDFAKALFIFLMIMLGFGIIIWLAERESNDQFRKDPSGIWDEFYYNIVVMSTVGFGDKAPKTLVGKVVTAFLIILYLIIGAILIGNISASIMKSGQEGIQDISQLSYLKVGTVRKSASSVFLDKHDIKYVQYDNSQEGMEAIVSGNLDAFGHQEVWERAGKYAKISCGGNVLGVICLEKNGKDCGGLKNIGSLFITDQEESKYRGLRATDLIPDYENY